MSLPREIEYEEETLYTTRITVEGESHESRSDSLKRLAFRMSAMAKQIEEDLDRAKSVMAP